MPGRRPVPSWLSACCRRSGDRATRRRVGVISGQSRHRACSPSALGFPAPPRRCCEGRREPSVGDPMKHRRSTTSALAGSSASSWWHSAWGGRRRRRIRQAKEIESRVRRRGGGAPGDHHGNGQYHGRVTRGRDKRARCRPGTSTRPRDVDGGSCSGVAVWRYRTQAGPSRVSTRPNLGIRPTGCRPWAHRHNHERGGRDPPRARRRGAATRERLAGASRQQRALDGRRGDRAGRPIDRAAHGAWAVERGDIPTSGRCQVRGWVVLDRISRGRTWSRS